MITSSPKIALLFGLLAIATSVILAFGALKWINYVFAVFWLVTGLLGFYSAFKR